MKQQNMRYAEWKTIPWDVLRRVKLNSNSLSDFRNKMIQELKTSREIMPEETWGDLREWYHWAHERPAQSRMEKNYRR